MKDEIIKMAEDVPVQNQKCSRRLQKMRRKETKSFKRSMGYNEIYFKGINSE